MSSVWNDVMLNSVTFEEVRMPSLSRYPAASSPRPKSKACFLIGGASAPTAYRASRTGGMGTKKKKGANTRRRRRTGQRDETTTTRDVRKAVNNSCDYWLFPGTDDQLRY